MADQFINQGEKYKEATKMGKQRNRPQMKEPENSPEELDEMEASNYQVESLE